MSDVMHETDGLNRFTTEQFGSQLISTELYEAMQAIISKNPPVECEGVNPEFDEGYRATALGAVMYADALILELERTK